MPGRLFIVALPIGNLSDITLRAIETLKTVDCILAEDTRTTRKLLDRYGIDTPFYSSFYQGVEEQRTDEILRQLAEGRQIALVSDAGTPLISDPGFPLVRRAVESGIPILPVPGPTAAICALIGSGFPTDRFCFEGAIPRRRGPRQALFESIRHERRTVVLYESPHRLLETLEILAEELPDRRACLARELTKLHEEFLRGTAIQIATVLRERGEVRGECVLVIEGALTQPEGPAIERASSLVAFLLEEGVAKSAIQQALILGLGMKRNEAYEAAHRAGESPP